MMMMMRRPYLYRITALAALAAANPAAAQDGAAVVTPSDVDYTAPANWLCRPGHNEPCDADLTTAVVAADGSQVIERSPPAAAAPAIDCFYAYPTVSLDRTPNSDMLPGPEERAVVAMQFARFRTVCRQYAPVYRSVTLGGLRADLTGQNPGVDRQLAYRDVRDAWRTYLKRDNKGRGVILIGHSQGSNWLARLLRAEIDGKPAQRRLVSAMLLGSNVMVPPGGDVGLDLQHIPLCRSTAQVGCLVTYASFRADRPPPPNSRYGIPRDGQQVACVNPAAPAGGKAPLHSYFANRPASLSGSATQAWSRRTRVTAPFVSLPGMVSAQCVTDAHGTYLAVTVVGDPADGRTDDIPGDIRVGDAIQDNWGLHLVDVDLSIGDLVSLAASQSTAWTKTRRK